MGGFNRENDPADDFKNWFSMSAMPDEMLLCLFEKTLRQYKDIQTVKTYAAKADLTPVEYASNEFVELDFDLLYKDDYICRIYKTWKDPGFRICKDLRLDKGIPDFENKLSEIFKICAKNFISCEPKEERIDKVCLTLEIGIFDDGFNEKVLRSVLEVFDVAMGRIIALLKE